MRVLARRTRAISTAVAAVAVTAVITVTAGGPAAAYSGARTPVSQASVTDARDGIPAFAGHIYRLEVDNGVVYQNSYSADGTRLHWEALEGPFKGYNGNETVSVQRIRDGVYHINWVESSGMTVSHVMDLSTKRVSVYWTYTTADSNRVGELHAASLTQIA